MKGPVIHWAAFVFAPRGADDEWQEICDDCRKRKGDSK